MAKVESFRQRSRSDVNKSIRDWEQDRQRHRRPAERRPAYRSRTSALGNGIGALLVFMALAAWPQVKSDLASLPAASSLLSNKAPEARSSQMIVSRSFPICGSGRRHNCVVDGDTFWFEGEKVRIADIDTPETSKPNCRSEKQRGDRATRRLHGLLNSGSFEMRGDGVDRYGRSLRTLHRDGVSLGDRMVEEGLAHEWRGQKQTWCG